MRHRGLNAFTTPAPRVQGSCGGPSNSALMALETAVEQLVWLPGMAETPAPDGWLTYERLLSDQDTPPVVDIEGSDLARRVEDQGPFDVEQATSLFLEAARAKLGGE